MKKTLIIILLLVTARLFAPDTGRVPVADFGPVNPFKPLIHAIGIVETGLDTLAYNPLEEATGYFQIRPIRLEDYNRKTGSSYTLQDCYDYAIAEKIFLHYAFEIGPYDFETIAKNWNGSGEMVKDYWKRVKAAML